MTAEKGEHERAPPVWVSWPAPLRATLRAPPSKWAIGAFFPAGERSEPRSRTAPKGLPQTEAWAERERVPSGHNCRRQLATDRPEQIQGPGTAVPGTPIFANYAQRGGPPLESPCRGLSLVLSFASKESTIPLGAAAPPFAPESARQTPSGGSPTAKPIFPAAYSGLSSGTNTRRGSHCRALRLLFACIPPAPFRKETNFPANGQPFPHTRAAHPHFPIKTGPLSFSESGPCSFSFVSPSARRGRLSSQRRRPTRPQRRCTRRPAWCSAEIHK